MPARPNRGSLALRLRMAADHTAGRLALMRDEMDKMSDVGEQGPLLGGGRLSRADFRSLIADDPSFQAKLAARLQFATDDERRALERQIERVLPSPDQLPDAVAKPPELPFPEEEARGSEASVV